MRIVDLINKHGIMFLEAGFVCQCCVFFNFKFLLRFQVSSFVVY